MQSKPNFDIKQIRYIIITITVHISETMCHVHEGLMISKMTDHQFLVLHVLRSHHTRNDIILLKLQNEAGLATRGVFATLPRFLQPSVVKFESTVL